MTNKKINEEEAHVLYIFEKPEELEEEKATNADIQTVSFFKKEKEVLFFLILVLRL